MTNRVDAKPNVYLDVSVYLDLLDCSVYRSLNQWGEDLLREAPLSSAVYEMLVAHLEDQPFQIKISSEHARGISDAFKKHRSEKHRREIAFVKLHRSKEILSEVNGSMDANKLLQKMGLSPEKVEFPSDYTSEQENIFATCEAMGCALLVTSDEKLLSLREDVETMGEQPLVILKATEIERVNFAGLSAVLKDKSPEERAKFFTDFPTSEEFLKKFDSSQRPAPSKKSTRWVERLSTAASLTGVDGKQRPVETVDALGL